MFQVVSAEGKTGVFSAAVPKQRETNVQHS